MTGKLDSLIVAQQNSSAQIVGWQFIPFGVAEPQSATVTIYRSEVENTGYSILARVPAERGWFLDDTVDLINRWQTAFYKLELTVDGVTREYGPVRIDQESDVQARGIVKHMNTTLRLSGIPVLVYQYLSSGERCPDCWDPCLRKVTVSNCGTCYGTGYQKGYHAPILTLSQMGVEAKQNQVNERIEQDASIEMLFSNYPVLRPGDLVYEIDRGRRYRVQQVFTAEHHRTLVNQTASGFALQTTDVEQQVPIPDISTMEPVLRRKRAPIRKVSSTNGEEFDNSTFDKVPF